MAKHVEALRMDGCPEVVFEIEGTTEGFELRALSASSANYLDRKAWALTRSDVAELAESLLRAVADAERTDRGGADVETRTTYHVAVPVPGTALRRRGANGRFVAAPALSEASAVSAER